MTLTDPSPYRNAPGYDEAVALDDTDPLRHHRDRYVHPDPDLIYLDGNSLGRLPVAALDTIEDITHRQWGDRLIRAWNEGWWEMQMLLGDELAPLLGAAQGEVIISDSTSVNLYKLALGALNAAPGGRDRVVTDDLNFPSDIYILEGVARQARAELVVVPSDGVNGPLEDLAGAIDDRTALVSLSHTTFKSGYTYDVAELTAMAHESGARVLWDCSHSAGAVPIDLGGCRADLAVGCTYKYLNGGPGSPAFLYVREDLHEELENPIAGWWGHSRPFAFDIEYEPVSGIRRFHTGTMPILSLAPIADGLRDVNEAGMDAIRAKSLALSDYLIRLVSTQLEPLGFAIASPLEQERRGSHVSITHEMAWPITVAMIERMAVIPDYRTPDSIRLGLSPLYTSFLDVHTAIHRIETLVKDEAHHEFIDTTATVT
jgi:kynureninase